MWPHSECLQLASITFPGLMLKGTFKLCPSVLVSVRVSVSMSVSVSVAAFTLISFILMNCQFSRQFPLFWAPKYFQFVYTTYLLCLAPSQLPPRHSGPFGHPCVVDCGYCRDTDIHAPSWSMSLTVTQYGRFRHFAGFHASAFTREIHQNATAHYYCAGFRSQNGQNRASASVFHCRGTDRNGTDGNRMALIRIRIL